MCLFGVDFIIEILVLLLVVVAGLNVVVHSAVYVMPRCLYTISTVCIGLVDQYGSMPLICRCNDVLVQSFCQAIASSRVL